MQTLKKILFIGCLLTGTILFTTLAVTWLQAQDTKMTRSEDQKLIKPEDQKLMIKQENVDEWAEIKDWLEDASSEAPSSSEEKWAAIKKNQEMMVKFFDLLEQNLNFIKTRSKR